MNEAVMHGHGPPASTKQLVRMDSYKGFLPWVAICPRCSHHGHLVFGLLKTPPVCIDCAVDPTWINPQENWPKDWTGLRLPQVDVFTGQIGPSRIIVQHPKYSILEQMSGQRDLLIVYNSRWTFKLPRCNEQIFDNHAAKYKLPIVTSMKNQVEKPGMQILGQLNATNIMQEEISELAEQSHQIMAPGNSACAAFTQQTSNPLLKALLYRNQQEQLSKLAVWESHAKPHNSTVDVTCMAQLRENVNKKQVKKHSVTKVNNQYKVGNIMTNPPMLNNQINLNNSAPAYEKSWRYHQEAEARIRNIQTPKLTGFGVFPEHTKTPQSMAGNTCMVLQQTNGSHTAVDLPCIQNMGKMHTPSMMCCALENPVLQDFALSDCCRQAYETNGTFNQDISPIQSEAMPINAQHARQTEVGNLIEPARPPERVAYCPYKVTIQENVYPTEFDKLHEDELSNWHQKNIFCSEFDKYNAFPTLTASAEHVIPPSANNWSHKVATHNIIPTNAETTSIFHKQMPKHTTFPDSVIPEQQVELSKATNWTYGMETQEKQMYAGMPTNQNINDWPSTSIHCNEFVNPKQLPQHVTSVDQVESPTEETDWTHKIATKENESQTETVKLSDQEVVILYPYSIFNSDLANPKSLTTTTEQGKSTETVKTTASEIETKEKCVQIEKDKLNNRQMLSTCSPYNIPICYLADPKSPSTTIEQEKATEDVTAMASNIGTIENCAIIELEQLDNQQTLSTCYAYIVLNSDAASTEPVPVSIEQETPMEEMIEKAFKMAQENCTQIQREKSNNQEVGIVQPCSISSNQLHKPDILPKLAPLPDHTTPPQKATNFTQKSASEEKHPQIEKASKSTNTEKIPFVKTSVGKVHEFETVEDLFAAHNIVLSNEPVLRNTTESTMKKNVKTENSDSGPCIVHHHPNITFPNKADETVEAAKPQKVKVGKTTVAVNQANCTQIQTDSRVDLNERVTYQPEEILVKDKTKDKLQSAMETERRNLRIQKAILKQLKELLAGPKSNVECEVIGNENREKQSVTNDISNHAHPRKKDMFLEDANEAPQSNVTCRKEERKLLNTSNSNIYKHCDTQTETTMHQEVKIKMELKVGSKRLRDEGMDVAPHHIEEKKPNLEQKQQLDTKKFERSRLAREQPIKKTGNAPTEQNTTASHKVEVLRNTHMTTKSGKVSMEKDLKCGAHKLKLSTKSNSPTEYNKDRKLSKEDTDPKIISKDRRVKMMDIAHCQKGTEKHEDDLRQAIKTQMTRQHQSSEASKRVYVHENQKPTADRLENAKKSEAVLRNEKSLKSTDSEEKLGRKRHYNERRSSESSKDDKAPLKNSFENQEFEIAATRLRIEEQESSSKSCRMEISEAQKAAQPLEIQQDIKRLNMLQFKKIVSSKHLQDLPKFANAKNVEKPKPESCSKKEGKEEQPNHTASGSVAAEQNKAKTPRHKNPEKVNTLEMKACNTMLPDTAKDPCLFKKVKSQKPLPAEATNFAKTRKVETQPSVSSSKSYERETPKQQNEKKEQKTQNQESRSEFSNENGHCKTRKRLSAEIPHNPKRPSKSDCGLPNAAHKREMRLNEDSSQGNSKDFIQIQDRNTHTTQTPQIPRDQNKLTQHHAKKVEHTNPEHIAKCRSVDKSIKEENLQSKKSCTSTSQGNLNEIKTEMPKLQNEKRTGEIRSDSDSRQVHRTMLPVEKPQDSKRISNSNCVMPRMRTDYERKRPSNPHSSHNQNNGIDNQKAHRTPLTSVPQKLHKHHSKEAECPKPSPDFKAVSKRVTFSPDIPQDSRGSDSLKFKKKPCTVTSQDKSTHLARSEMKTEMPRIQNKEREIDDDDSYGKAHRTGLDSERLSNPDHAMPRNTDYGRERHPKQQSDNQYSSEHWVQNQDDQSDARNDTDNCKAHRKTLPSETPQDHEFARPNSGYFDKPQSSDGPQDCEQGKHQRAKDPRILARMEQEHQNASTETLLAGVSNLASHDWEPLEGEVKEVDQVLLDLQIHVFNRESVRLKSHSIEESIYEWSKILIKTVPSKRQCTDVNKAKYAKWQRLTNILAGCANPDLIFRERQPFDNDVISKSIQLMSFMFCNNTLQISIYAHAFGLWACVKQSKDSGALQRRKHFIAKVEQGNAEKDARHDGGFERKNARESYEDAKSHEVANNERCYEPSQRHTGRYPDEFARPRREYQDQIRTKYRRNSSMQEMGYRRERHHPARQHGPRNRFSKDGGYNQQRRRDSV